jgi:hypothetical protein
VEWHPPHLEKPVIIQRNGPKKKPYHPALIQASVAAFAIGIGIVTGGLMLMSNRVVDSTSDFFVVGMLMKTGGPAIMVPGAIILALGGTRKAWLSCIPATLLMIALACGSVTAFVRLRRP